MGSFATTPSASPEAVLFQESRKPVRASVWIILWVVALTTRLAAGFYLPNAEQDGYSDAETIARLSAALASGQFHLSDLYGFWLPLFQLVAAIPNLCVGDALLCGKLLSALCGAISCVLVFAVSLRLTQHTPASIAAFGVVLLNPLHLLYSAACMTDVPFACMVLASLWFLLGDRWFWAAICAALAGAIRVEAWVLIPLLPTLQFLRQRRISLGSCLLLLLPPLGWLYVSQVARGDWFAFFQDRRLYHAHYIQFHPSRSGFALTDMRGDIDYLMLGANWLVFLASVAAGLLVLVQYFRRRRISWDLFVTAAYVFAIVAFLLLAYVTKRQPVWLPRYGLILFVLGLPLLAWISQQLLDNSKPAWIGRVAAAVILVVSLSVARPQLPIIPKVMNDFQAHTRVANALIADLKKHNDNTRHCFSDDIAVRVLSHLPPGRLHRSTDLPATAWDQSGLFEEYLREHQVGYVVFMPTEDSLPVKFYPELGQKPGPSTEKFQQIAYATSAFGPDVWLYRVSF
jgi:hypothetical protein